MEGRVSCVALFLDVVVSLPGVKLVARNALVQLEVFSNHQYNIHRVNRGAAPGVSHVQSRNADSDCCVATWLGLRGRFPRGFAGGVSSHP